jgi:hypothetical protein
MSLLVCCFVVSNALLVACSRQRLSGEFEVQLASAVICTLAPQTYYCVLTSSDGAVYAGAAAFRLSLIAHFFLPT